MEYQKIMNIQESMTNQAPKYRTKTSIKINDNKKPGRYAALDQINFETTMLKLTLYDYSDAYILAKRTITITERGGGDAKPADKRNADVIP